MATTAVSPRPAPFDIRSNSACSIRLGRSVERPSSSSSSSSRYTSVQYNHKPVITDAEQASTSITPPESGSKLHTLRLKDGGDEYTYRGSQGGGDFTYILLPDKDGNGYTLERLDSSLKFNLTSAPWEDDATVLAKRYPQFGGSASDDEDGGLSGELDNTEQDLEADADNPFDFRHYISTTDSPSPQTQPTRASTYGTPSSLASHSQASTRTNTPLAKSTRKPPTSSAFASQDNKPKAKPKPKQSALAKVTKKAAPKRIKLSPEAEDVLPDANIPTVRLDRRASTRPTVPAQKKAQPQAQSQQQSQSKSQTHAQKQKQKDEPEELSLELDGEDDDNDGDLILEGDAPQPSYRAQGQRSLGLALSGHLGGGGNGPRSLLSAASSPASHRSVNSPYQGRYGGAGSGRRSHGDSDEEIEIEMDADAEEVVDDDDDGSLVLEDVQMDEADDRDTHRRHEDDADTADADAFADEDVDEMHLPSPAQVHRPSISDAVVTADDDAVDDDDDDLEKQMFLALEGGDDEEPQNDSEEESEEE